MLVDLTLIPLGTAHPADALAEARAIVAASGLAWQPTPAGTCIEGGWDEVLDVVRRCHEHLRRCAPHVVTLLKIDDDAVPRERLQPPLDGASWRALPLGAM